MRRTHVGRERGRGEGRESRRGERREREREDTVHSPVGDAHVHADERVCRKKKGRCRPSSGASRPIVHARGWVGSLLKCKPSSLFFFLSFFPFFFEGWKPGGTRLAGRRGRTDESRVRERERKRERGEEERGEGWQHRDPRRDSSIRDRRETGRLGVRRYFPPPEDPRRSLLLSDCYLHPGCLHCFNVIRDRSLCLPIRCAFGGIPAEGFARKKGGGM